MKDWGRRLKKGCPFSTLPKSFLFQRDRATPHLRKWAKAKQGKGSQTTRRKWQVWGSSFPASWDEPASYTGCSSENHTSCRTRCSHPPALTVSAFGRVQSGMLWHSPGMKFPFSHPKTSLDLVFPLPRRKQSILSTMEEPPVQTVSKPSFLGCPLVSNVSCRTLNISTVLTAHCSTTCASVHV